MKKTRNVFKAAPFRLVHDLALSGRRSIFIDFLDGRKIVGESVCAYSKATARRLSKQLREAADWVDMVWK